MALQIKSQTGLSFIDLLKLDGNFKTKTSTFSVPSGTLMNVGGYTVTGSQGIRFDEYPFQIGYIVSFEVFVDKACTLNVQLTSLLSANVERIHRQHSMTWNLQAGQNKIHTHNNFVSPGTVLNCLLKATASQTGSGATATTSEITNFSFNYSWIELPNNTKHTDVNGIVLGIGDSITYGYGVSRAFDKPYDQWFARTYKWLLDKNPNIKMINRGIAGSTAENIQVLANNGYFNVSEPDKVKLVTIMLGTNVTPDLATFQAAMIDIITRAVNMYRNAIIVVIGAVKYTGTTSNYETRLETFRVWEQSYVATLNNPKVRYFNMATAVNWDDTTYGLINPEVHPNAAGNVAMGDAFIAYLAANNIKI